VLLKVDHISQVGRQRKEKDKEPPDKREGLRELRPNLVQDASRTCRGLPAILWEERERGQRRAKTVHSANSELEIKSKPSRGKSEKVRLQASGELRGAIGNRE